MTETENLVLEHLRAIRSDMPNMRDEMRTMHAEITALRQQTRASTTLQEQCLEDIATVRVRLDRIERRLELTDMPSPAQ